MPISAAGTLVAARAAAAAGSAPRAAAWFAGGHADAVVAAVVSTRIELVADFAGRYADSRLTATAGNVASVVSQLGPIGVALSAMADVARRRTAPPGDILERAASLAVGTLVEMFELDATALGGSLYRFTNSAVEADVVRFGGESYYPAQFEADGWAVTTRGTIPRPTVRLVPTPALLVAASMLDDLRGAVVRRIRTLRQYLDDGETPDTGQQFPNDVYMVNRAIRRDATGIEFELTAMIDQDGKQLPARQAFRTVCTHHYRVFSATASPANPFDYSSATCPYSSDVYFDKNGQPTTDPKKDRCGKRLSDCRKRFGAQGVLPTRAFPGMVRI